MNWPRRICGPKAIRSLDRQKSVFDRDGRRDARFFRLSRDDNLLRYRHRSLVGTRREIAVGDLRTVKSEGKRHEAS